MQVSEELLIGGEWVSGPGPGGRLTTVDPATGEPLGTVADAGVEPTWTPRWRRRPGPSTTRPGGT